MNPFLARLREEKGLVKPIPYASIVERPEPSFADLVEIYEKDEDARLACQFFAKTAVGIGHYTTSDPQGDPEAKAKQVVDEFAEGVNLDRLLLEGMTEVVAYGFSAWEKIAPGNLQNLKILPISSQWDILRDDIGHLQKVTQIRGGRPVEFRPDELLLWTWDVSDAKPFGRGLLHTLAETTSFTLKYTDQSTETLTVPSLHKIKAQNRFDLMQILHYNVPRAAWYFEKADADFIAARARDLRKMRPGEAIATNKRPEIAEQVLDPRGRYEPLLAYWQHSYAKALQSPIMRLYTQADFNRASAEVIKELYQWQIQPFQRYVKRTVEREIYWPVLLEAGYNPEQVKVRLHWGVPEQPEILIADLLKAVELGIVRVDEARKMLMKFGFELSEEPFRPLEATP